jgi:DNA/RNA-binding protein KIN17
MKLFSENAGSMMDSYSKDFARMYVETLRMRHGCSQINANNVYQEVIADKQHVHMNSTMWASLSDFVQYLGKTGQCVVEQNERGWYVTYIERDATKLERAEALQRREKGELAAEQAVSQRMQEQRVQAAIALDKVGGTIHTEATALQRTDGDATIQLALTTKKKKSSSGGSSAADKIKTKSVFGQDEDDDDEDEEPPHGPPLPPPPPPLVPSRPTVTDKSNSNNSLSSLSSKKRPRPADADTKNQKVQRLLPDDSDSVPWLYKDILVRIVHKTLRDGRYFKRKAAVDELVDDNQTTARVTVLDSGPDKRDGGDVLELDQDDLETVVPKQTGKRVRILRGRYRGKRATVMELDKNKYRAVLELSDGTRLDRVDYDDFSKLA